MAGTIKLSSDWKLFNGIEITDINNIKNNLVSTLGDKFTLQLEETGDNNILFVWTGDKPSTANTIGSMKLSNKEQGYLQQGVNDIYIKGIGNLNIAKVE